MSALTVQALAGMAAGTLFAGALSALLAALKSARAHPGSPFGFAAEAARLVSPDSAAGWLRLAGIVVAGLLCGGAAAAFIAARHGVRSAGKT